jgi:hypothetical protein
MKTMQLASIDLIEIDLGSAIVNVGDRVEITGIVDMIRGNLVEITGLGMTEPQLITGRRTATLTVTKIEFTT